MAMHDIKISNIDAFISGFPPETQEILEQLRATIKDAAPDSEEKISYGIPTFTLKGNLVHFAAYKHHIGFYPGTSCIEAFKNELAPYKLSKGTVQFPLGQPLPLDLITQMVQFRVKENLKKQKGKKAKKLYKVKGL